MRRRESRRTTELCFTIGELTEVFIIDDSSKDATIQKAVAAKWTSVNTPLRVFRTPYNQGYGGNQRLGYSYAIAQKFDIVVLLHGDVFEPQA